MSKEKASSTVTHIDPGRPHCPPGRRGDSHQAGGEGNLGPWPWGVVGHIFRPGCAPRFLLRSMASPLRPHLPSPMKWGSDRPCLRAPHAAGA